MNVNRICQRYLRRMLPCLITCCLVAFCSQSLSKVRFEPALRVLRADAVRSPATAEDLSPFVVR